MERFSIEDLVKYSARLSADEMEHLRDLDGAATAGMNAHLAKPINVDEVFRVLGACWNSKAGVL